MSSIDDLIREVRSQYLRPPRIMRGSTWADEYGVIAKGPEPGPWRTSRTPYLREILDAFDPEDPVQRVVLQFATQMGKTQAMMLACMKRIHLAPADLMIVMPTLQDAKDFSRQRFAPSTRAIPEVRKNMPEPRSRIETDAWNTKELAHGLATLYFAGANSARSLASKPLGFVICDEIDGYVLDLEGEGDPLSLVRERMSNFPYRKLLLASTPTLRDFSRIESEYLASDQRRYHVPCPHCGDFQTLVWGTDVEYGLRWLKTPDGDPRPETAVYVCKGCGASIQESAKTTMLAEGKWIADRPGAARGLIAGFHLSKLYSPIGWKSWPMLVEDWQQAQIAARSGDVSRLKSFVNTSLAETWEESGDKANMHELLRRAADIPMRIVAADHFVMTAGVDVQGDRLECYLWAWGRGMRRQLVDRAVLYGDPALPESEPESPWAALTAYRRMPVLHVNGGEVPILATMVDSGGHHTQASYAYARAHRSEHVNVCKGMSQAAKAILGKPTDQDVNWRGQKLPKGVKLWPMGSDTAKAEFYGRLRITEPGPGYVLLSKHMPAEIFEQLTSERMVTKYIKGHAKLEWQKPPGRRNEGLDCASMALAAAHFVGIDRWKEGDWRRWEGKIATVRAVAAPPIAVSTVKTVTNSEAMPLPRPPPQRSAPMRRPTAREW